ncbi:MAG: S8 family serine peptidase [Rhizonema sp. NSF051]|nr:S8 family serine peptidase [Rhizonema sp. NSF051]
MHNLCAGEIYRQSSEQTAFIPTGEFATLGLSLALRVSADVPDFEERSTPRRKEVLRPYIRAYKIGAEFHGTWVSGVIAAKPQNGEGVVGVALNAQILPVRVFGLNGSYTPSAYIEAIGYAADRGADVINLSLGATLPSQGAIAGL